MGSQIADGGNQISLIIPLRMICHAERLVRRITLNDVYCMLQGTAAHRVYTPVDHVELGKGHGRLYAKTHRV